RARAVDPRADGRPRARRSRAGQQRLLAVRRRAGRGAPRRRRRAEPAAGPRQRLRGLLVAGCLTRRSSSLAGTARDDRRVAAGAVTTRIGQLFVILGLDVYRPRVMPRAVEDVLDGQHRRVHRVVLVVVLVHAVATDRVHVAGVLLEPAAHDVDVLAVVLVVGRIRLRHPNDVTRLDPTGIHEAEGRELALAELDELGVVHGPQVVALEHEVLEAQAGTTLLHHPRRPRSEVLDATHAS